jgi:DNA helicase IV
MAAADAPEGHPEWGVERERLAATRAAMEVAAERSLRRTGGGDMDAAIALEVQRVWYREALQAALRSPYFGRIDFFPQDAAGPETYYIGKTYFDGGAVSVTGWQAPVAALFYRATSTAAVYTAPEGEIRGVLELKRRLVIDRGELRHVADDLDARLPGAGRGAVLPAGAGDGDGRALDGALAAALSGGASPWLRDIIATIQPEQYALIAAPGSEVLVVQGVAGSGKTSVALHRLSYLVYPDLAAGRLAPRCLVFGPNQLFLKYISSVLPQLGLRHAVQTTIADWALARLGLERESTRPGRRVRLTDATFEALLDRTVPAAEGAALVRRSRLKTSRRMGDLLERYVEWRRRRIDIPEDGWTATYAVNGRPFAQHLPAAEVREHHARGATQPFAIHRALLASTLQAAVLARLEAETAARREEAETKQALSRRRLQQATELEAEAARLRAGGGPPGRATGGAGGAGTRPGTGPGGHPAFGEAPVFGPGGAGRPARASAGGAPPPADGALRQTLRQWELTAQRRRGEGETLALEAAAALAAGLTAAERETARREVAAAVQRLVDRHWPAVNPRRDYAALLADAPLLAGLADGLFDAPEVELLAAARPAPGETVDLADLPAVHYLYILSQSPEAVGRTQHAYVVIDEAQDVSPLDLLCLRRLEQRPCFTILGDLAQSIYAHRGLTSWDEAAEIFAGQPYRFAENRVSYRTTAEITALANRVLRRLTAGGAGARPVGRHGPEPALTGVADPAALPAAVAGAVSTLRRREYSSVGIVTRTAARARELAPLLAAAGAEGVQLALAPGFEFRGGVVLLPVALAKGLEFDAAVVVDADGETYGPDAFDGRLLYVALTRAMHELHVLWAGGADRLSPHLAAPA